MEIVITYDKVEGTCVEIYTLPVVAVARMNVLRAAGYDPCLTITKEPIVEVN